MKRFSGAATAGAGVLLILLGLLFLVGAGGQARRVVIGLVGHQIRAMTRPSVAPSAAPHPNRIPFSIWLSRKPMRSRGVHCRSVICLIASAPKAEIDIRVVG